MSDGVHEEHDIQKTIALFQENRTKDEIRLISRMYRDRQLAIEDPSKFFSYCMREETTRERVKCLPHQQLLYDFVMAHPLVVVRMPVGTSKSYSMSALTLWLLGRDNTSRGAIISSTQTQSAKPLAMVRAAVYNDNNEFPEIRSVFKDLKPSQREGEHWTQAKLTIDRPAGIRDPSLTAVGVDGSLPGARLNWILVDDILDRQNTSTPEGRKKVKSWFNTTVLSRRDARGARVVVTNTPWHPEDLTYDLEKAGWPTITMDIEGCIWITNTDWDSDLIRPAFNRPGDYCRLTIHDMPKYGAPECIQFPDGTIMRVEDANGKAKLGKRIHFDIDEEIPLWPERFDREVITDIRKQYAASMHEYNQLYMCVCRDDDSSRCKIEWVNNCKDLARSVGFTSLVARYDGNNPTVTGVDLAIGTGKQHDYTSFFTIEIIPRIEINGRTYKNMRRILDVEFGRFRGKEIVDKLIDKAKRYKSMVRVETNSAQAFIRQWALDVDASLPVRAHVTGENKHHRAHGVESVFIEIANGSWLIPNDVTGKCHTAVQKWIDECIYYQPPPAHTGDLLMSSWMAREEARYIGVTDDSPDQTPFGMSIMMR